VKLENSITIGVATKEVSMNMALFELLKGVTFSKKKKSFSKYFDIDGVVGWMNTSTPFHVDFSEF